MAPIETLKLQEQQAVESLTDPQEIQRHQDFKHWEANCIAGLAEQQSDLDKLAALQKQFADELRLLDTTL